MAPPIDLRGRRRQRRLPSAIVWACTAVALPLALASAAFACTAQAQIQNSTEVARRDEVVTGSARGFSASPAASAIVLRLDGDGAVLWQGRADINGSAEYSFVVPDLPGHHVVVAYQSGATGDPVPGTPARAPLTIEAPPAPKPATAPSPAPPARSEPQAVATQSAPAPQEPLVAVPEPAAETAPLAATDAPAADRSPPRGNSAPAGSPSYLLPWLLTGGAVLAALGAVVAVAGSANRRRGEPARRYRS